MHPDDKLANHGKQVSGESGSLVPSVTQQAQQQQGAVVGHLGPKGGNGVKSNQASPGSRVLKSVSQSMSSTGGMLKPKSKRERSVSTELDVKNVRTSVDSDAKGEGIMRSKRRCVLERKQPYSGDEWCSGHDTEEDEEKPQSAIHQKTMVGPVPGLCDLRTSESGPGPGLRVEPKQTSPQLVYVFTTSLANSAADAVLKGQSDSILLFHQQNVPRPKLEQVRPEEKKTPNMLEKVRSTTSPIGCTHKSQSGTPRPSSAGVVGMTLQAGTLPSSGLSDNELTQTRSSIGSHNNMNMTRAEASCLPAGLVPASRDRETLEGMMFAASSVSPSQSPTAQSLHHQGGPENLSKEQLEHRERSLQTLRDIERLFLRPVTNPEHGDPESASNNPNNPNITERGSILEGTDIGRTISGGSANNNNVLSSSQIGNLRKYEEPLQSIISQTQALHAPQVDHNIDHPHHQMSSPGMDIGHLLGPDGLTPEQIAWRKLQEEYYQEKRRQQEMQPSAHPQDFRISEMQMQGGPMMLRGPPPPYHSKPGEPQWTNEVMAGGVRGNTQILDMQEGRHGSRFVGQAPRGPPGAGFPGNSGAFPIERVGHQRPGKPGMPWLDEMSGDAGARGPFHSLYTSGSARHLQGNAERLLAREMFRTVGQCQMLRTLQLSKQQQQHSSLMSRLMDNPGDPDFPHLMMGRRPPSSQNDPLDFPGSRDILVSPGAGPQIKDLVDSPLGPNIPLNLNPSMNLQQQQLNLAQKLRGPPEIGPLSEIFGPAMSQGRHLQNRQGEKMGMNPGPDGPFQFPNQSPFSGGQDEGPYLQADPDMFEEQGPNQTGGTMRLTHMPMTGVLRGPDARSRHPSDPTLNPLSSPSLPASHRLKSPSEEPVSSPLLPSPSGTGIKSPSKMSSVVHQPPLPPASGACTPSSASIKSPAVVGSSSQGLQSPSASPGQLKSPAVGGVTVSPGWTSPKPALPSPNPASGKTAGNGGPSETDQSLPPRSSTSTPISQPASTNTNAPFTSSPEVPPAQNPLSLIMSQMSKYAMPSSTPLYHDAIKTLASSDDEMLPDRPLLSGVSIGGNIGNPQGAQLLGPEPQSPMGVISQGQHPSHDASGPMLPSPNQTALSSMNSVMMGGGGAEGIGLCNVSPLSQNQMGGFLRLQSSRLLHSPVGEMSQNFNQSSDNIMPHQQLHMISKGLPNQRHPLPDSFGSLRDCPDLSEVIRPTRTGIPEFDLSRIIPCDKPSSILQYFPKSDSHQNTSQRPPSQQPSPQLLKQLSSTYPPHSNGSSNPHIAHLQNMMAEQQLQPPPHGMGRQGMGGSRGMAPGAAMGPMCPPGQMMGRPTLSLQQQQHGIMPNNALHHSVNPYQGMMTSQQHAHSTMAQHNMMLQAKQQGLVIPGDPFGPQGPLLSPQGPMMGLPQPGMMGPQSIRQRGMSLGSPISYGPGGMANMPF